MAEKKTLDTNQIDIKEIEDLNLELLEILLKDRSSGENIIWATDTYKEFGDNFSPSAQITVESITGKYNEIIKPRIQKSREVQEFRSKDKAEVFTPSWVCNVQNNLIDEVWFGRKDVFNREIINKDGTHSWVSSEEKVLFPEDNSKKTWKKYVVENRMEITCGEAPYLVSRYDTTTGEYIPIRQRIGILDRKLRIVSENTESKVEWLEMVRKAFQHTYGYEWQGDNLLLARRALLYTFIEYYIDRFSERNIEGDIVRKQMPDKKSIIGIAKIISWNIWQMDGLKFVIPDTCKKVKVCVNQKEIDYAKEDPFRRMFPEDAGPIPEPLYELQECPGCVSGDPTKHTGIYSKIRDWSLYENRHKDKDGKIGKERCDKLFIKIYNESRNK